MLLVVPRVANDIEPVLKITRDIPTRDQPFRPEAPQSLKSIKEPIEAISDRSLLVCVGPRRQTGGGRQCMNQHRPRYVNFVVPVAIGSTNGRSRSLQSSISRALNTRGSLRNRSNWLPAHSVRRHFCAR